MARESSSGFVNGLLLGAAAVLVCAEILRPLRRRREPSLPHTRRNALMGGVAAATVQVCEQPIVLPLARLVERRRWGLLARLPLPPWLKAALAMLALDYTLYVWHVLAHRLPGLWRFHLVHHVDLDLDASTGVRFHFGELMASVPWRAAQVMVIGVTPAMLARWQTLTLLSVLFHHSNVRLPWAVERVLGWLVVTPRMHGIHHSRAADELNANWSSGLSLWDRLHGTLRLDVPQSHITIGVAGYDDADEVAFPRLLALPFSDGAGTPPAAARPPAAPLA